MHVCCIAALRCYCFTTNVTYRLIQVKWFTTVIQFESKVLPHCSCHVWLWNQFHLCFYSVKSQLALPLACYSSRGSHVALCVMSGQGPASAHRHKQWLTRGFTWETRGKQTSMQMEIIEAGKIIRFIFIYHTTDWFIDYCNRPSKGWFWLKPISIFFCFLEFQNLTWQFCSLSVFKCMFVIKHRQLRN